MDKYRRKQVGDEEETATAPNEIRISNGQIRTYVDVALRLLQEEKYPHVAIRGKGKTVNKAVTVTEIVKRKLVGRVTQQTQISSVKATDSWEPIEEGLDRITVTRNLPCIELRLTMIPEPNPRILVSSNS
ncbi:hypothetical protein BJ742DRAFT_812190 [Cladochytrium replicatum]|nr:hypothetical protein BJ742DRAFT_812190 [Cladochytrium replicatum]